MNYETLQIWVRVEWCPSQVSVTNLATSFGYSATWKEHSICWQMVTAPCISWAMVYFWWSYLLVSVWSLCYWERCQEYQRGSSHFGRHVSYAFFKYSLFLFGIWIPRVFWNNFKYFSLTFIHVLCRFRNFPQEAQLWQEVKTYSDALQSEATDERTVFLKSNYVIIDWLK